MNRSTKTSPQYALWTALQSQANFALDLKVHFKVFYRDMATLLIGDVAERAGVTPPTVRYYESLGLLKRPVRSASGYRRYAEDAVRELQFIRKARALGFSLDEISEIVKLTRSGKTPCARVMSLAHQHLEAVQERIRLLETFRDQLATELARWVGPTAPNCKGVCGMIDSATPDLDAAAIELHPTRRLKRGR
jgi:DNA-binding transcriptional MerR regulator